MPKKKKTEQVPKTASAPETKKEPAAPKKQNQKPVIVTEKPEPPFSDFADPGFKIPKGETLDVTFFNKNHISVYAITHKTYQNDTYYLYEIKGESITKIDKAKTPTELSRSVTFR